MRLQIILMGWEYDRFIVGLQRYPSEKVIFVISSNANIWKKKMITLSKKIGSLVPLVDKETLFFDYYNVEEALFGLIKILEEHKNYDEIIINISSGTKPVIIAAVLAAQFYPITLFYTIPKEYNYSKDTFISSGVVDTMKVPTFSLSKIIIPSQPQRELLKYLTDQQISLNQLVENFLGRKVNYREAKNHKARFLYLIKQLREKGLVETKLGNNQQLYIKLTQTGRFLLRLIK